MVTEFVYPSDTRLSEILKSSASKVDDYYYLPYYFRIMSDGQISCSHIMNMPDDL